MKGVNAAESQNARLQEILANPTAVYSVPDDVVRDGDLTDAEKMQILKAWKFDAHELVVASGEGMTGGEPAMLSRVNDAILALEAASR